MNKDAAQQLIKQQVNQGEFEFSGIRTTFRVVTFINDYTVAGQVGVLAPGPEYESIVSDGAFPDAVIHRI